MDKRMRSICFAVLSGSLLWLGLLAGCQNQTAYGESQPVVIDESSQTTVITSIDPVWAMLGKVSKDRVLRDLGQLTGDTPICADGSCHSVTNRLTGSEGLRWATNYIYTELAGLGYAVEFLPWSRAGHADRNVVARKAGVVSPTEELYFVAHIDGVGSGSERFPAADDNASGAIGNLEAARILSRYSFSRTVVLLFSTGEEQGTLGVQSYLARLSPKELSSVKYVVNVDMVGYDTNRDGAMELWHGGKAPSQALAHIMSATIGAFELDLAPGLVVGCG